jgi:site-specific recombinase XerD
MPTLTDILDAFLGNHRTRARLKPATLRAYRKDLAAAAAALLGPIEMIGAGDLAAYLDCAIAPSTATRRLAALRAFFAWPSPSCVRQGCAPASSWRSTSATPKSLRGLRAHLREHRGEPSYAPLFRSNRGTRLSYDALHYHWGQLCIAASLVDEANKPRYTIHQLRHTRATELVEQGQRIEIVQRVLGHRDPRSTQGYAELNEAKVRAALEENRV